MTAAVRVEVAEEGLHDASMWEAETGLEACEMAHSMHRVLRAATVFVYRVGQQYEDGPFGPTSPGICGDIARQLASLALWADDLGPAFEADNHAQLERIRNPQPGESLWDVSVNT